MRIQHHKKLNQNISIACIVLGLSLLTTCMSHTRQAWTEDLPDKTRFNIPVFEIKGQSPAKNIQATQIFAAEVEKISGKPSFVDHPIIRKEILLKGQLIPSSNYKVMSKFNQIGNQHIIQLRIVSLQDGKVLSAISHTAAQFNQDLFRQLAKRLFVQSS